MAATAGIQCAPTASEAELDRWVGRSASRQFVITEQMIGAFAELSGDRSAIHVDDAYARTRELAGKAVHGALQAALVSCILGMDLPGTRGMLQELSLQFRKPCCVGDTVTVDVVVVATFSSVQAIRMEVKITNQLSQIVATGEVRSGVAPQ